MVEVDPSFESLSTVTMPTPDSLLGGALIELERRCRRAGVALDITQPEGYGQEGSSYQSDSLTSGKVLRCPKIIEFAITQAIDVGRATGDNVAVCSSNPRSVLVPGNVVALFQPKGSVFLRIFGTSADFGGGKVPSEKLPLLWDSERFLVVSQGGSRLAFFSPGHRRFLRIDAKGILSASGSEALHVEDRPRADELFQIQDGSPGTIQLYSDLYSKTVCPNPYGTHDFSVFQILGLEF